MIVLTHLSSVLPWPFFITGRYGNTSLLKAAHSCCIMWTGSYGCKHNGVPVYKECRWGIHGLVLLGLTWRVTFCGWILALLAAVPCHVAKTSLALNALQLHHSQSSVSTIAWFWRLVKVWSWLDVRCVQFVDIICLWWFLMTHTDPLPFGFRWTKWIDLLIFACTSRSSIERNHSELHSYSNLVSYVSGTRAGVTLTLNRLFISRVLQLRISFIVCLHRCW